MPGLKRTYSGAKKAAAKKRGRGSRSLVGYRLKLNSALAHRHVVTCSTSSDTAIFINYPASGVATFNNGILSSANMQLIFTLGSLVVNIGGVAAVSIPVPNATELQALYDQYTIEKVDVSIWCGATVSQPGIQQTGIAGVVTNYFGDPLPLIGWAPDMDDAADTSITQLQQYSQYKCKQLGQSKPLKTSVVPCCADTLYRPGATSAYARAPYQAVNCTYLDVPHYGLKFSVDGFKAGSSDTPQNSLISIQAKYHLKMMATR